MYCPNCEVNRGEGCGDVCPCGYEFVAPIKPVLFLEFWELAYIHSSSQENIQKLGLESKLKVGDMVCLIEGEGHDKYLRVFKEGSMDYLLDRDIPYSDLYKILVTEEKNNVDNSRTCVVNYKASTISNNYSMRRKETYIGWKSVDVKHLCDCEDEEEGYLHYDTGGAWSCGVPYGVKVRMLHNHMEEDDKADISVNGRIVKDEHGFQIRGILICESPEDVYNLTKNFLKKGESWRS